MATCPADEDRARYRRVHRISSRVCDDRETPLVWDETKRVVACFEQKGNKNLFRIPHFLSGARPGERRWLLLSGLSAEKGTELQFSRIYQRSPEVSGDGVGNL